MQCGENLRLTNRSQIAFVLRGAFWLIVPCQLSAVLAVVAILLTTSIPVSAGGGHKHEYGYGDTPGNPLVQEDAAAGGP